jgi:Carboxypeptidase regulatory-like domain/TonB-dependent Receptor Plug Domain/TonB dependent receptor
MSVFAFPGKAKVVLSLFVVLVLSVTVVRRAYAQVAGATLTGTVTDGSGGVVPRAQITIKNVATGISTTTLTNSEGLYSAPNLLPGDYDLTVSAAGFRTELHNGINLTVGAQQVLNIALQIGETSQQIQVTAAAPIVELASSSIDAVVSANTIVDLPLNGRDWTLLAALQPGVSAVTTQRPNSSSGPKGNRGYGQEMSISGTRPQLNNYRLDGISIVDYAGGSPGSALGVALGTDAVEEFSVSTSNQAAEYGRTAGGVINAITRSGTNQIHGDAYWFIRDEGFDARGFFDTSLPPFHRNQFGASVGGPIQKDKTFFFVDYEGLRQSLGATSVDIVPSSDARNGIVHPDGVTQCTIGVPGPPPCTLTNSAGTVGVDPLVKPFLALYPLPSPGGLIAPGDTGFFNIATNQISTENYTTARVDRKFSEKDNFFATFFWDKALSDGPDPLNDVLVGNESRRYMGALEESHVFSPSLVNSVRGGFSRVAVLVSGNVQAINPLVTDAALSSEPGVPGLAVFSVPGITGFVGGGVGNFTFNNYTWNSFQAYDDASLTKGVHSIKFGFAFERMQINILFPANPTGAFTFGSLTQFLTNQPSSFTGGVPGTTTPRGIRQSLFGGYVQDDFHVRPNLTLNLGLRYETVTVPTEVQNKLAVLPTLTSSQPNLGSPYFQNPTKRDFEPRVGFSWDPFRDGKTAVRGAFGIFDALPLNYEFNQAQVQTAPFAQQFSASPLPQGSFPSGVTASGGTVGLQLTSSYVEQNPHRNYVMIWNLNVQRQLSPNTTVMVGYVGNHGVHMLDRTDDADTVLPVSTTPAGLLFPPLNPDGSSTGTRLNTNVGAIIAAAWGGDSEYDALEAQVTKRMSHGFQVQGSYTWGKGIDTGSASVLGDPFTNSISSLFFFCKRCRRGLSDYNIAQTLVVNYLWDVPTPKSWGSIRSHVLGGWELGGIITAETGVPITPLIGGDPLGLSSTDPYDFPNRLTGPGCGGNPVNPGNVGNYIKINCFAVPMQTPAIAAQCTPFSAVPVSCANLAGNAGRNSVIGPGLVTFDFSLFKNNYIRKISEALNAQFRAEFFNILNRANFSTPFANEALFDQTGSPIGGAGSLSQTSTPAREIQFALKLIW